MKTTLLLLSALLYANGLAQDPAPPDSAPAFGWKHGLVSSLTLTQVAYTDWAQGGENALAYTLSIDGKSVEAREETEWTTLYKFAFGQTRLGNQGLRKTDDIIDMSTVLVFKLGFLINPYGSASLKTQFAKGYSYDATGNGTAESKFFDPAYLTQSVGPAYQPAKEVKTRLGIGVREVITSDFRKYADNPATADTEKVSIDGGIESVTNIDWPIEENILFTSQLEFFAPIKAFNELVTRNTTTITAKVSKYITAIFSVQLINEPRTSPKVQLKESIALGLSYTIF